MYLFMDRESNCEALTMYILVNFKQMYDMTQDDCDIKNQRCCKNDRFPPLNIVNIV
jgi:hypothetical protein